MPGGAYAGEPGALAAQIDGFFTHADGPGSAARSADSGVVRGLLAPHIDFHRGGPTYAWAYREVIERSDADLFVILGTCHAGMPDPFAATLKPYDTPLGPAPIDRDFFDALERRCGGGLLASEAAHRTEHSIEFQVVMLRHLLGKRRPFTILPVLASYVHEAVWARTDPEADPRVPRFIDGLLETMAASGRKTCLIAGVDLAHVGPRFGDPEANTDDSLAAVAAADRSMLEAVVAGRAHELLRVGRSRRRPPAHLRALAHLHLPARAARRARPAHPLQPVAGSRGGGDVLRRGLSVTTPAEPAAPGGIPAGWKLPRLRITRDGEWLHEGEEVTHPGILANLRENLKVDADGHYLVAGPARVPVELEDAPVRRPPSWRRTATGSWRPSTICRASRSTRRRSASTARAFPTAG